MSSAGLIYKFYGKEVLRGLIKGLMLAFEEENMDKLYNNIYEDFIKMVDAKDNGINQYDNKDELKARYHDNTSFQSQVGRLNPLWNETKNAGECFKFAMAIAENELLSQVRFLVLGFFPAYAIVKEAVMNREKFHKSGEVMLLQTSCPWKEHLNNLEEELNIVGKIKFVLFKDQDGGFRVQTVGLTLGSFSFRLGLKTEWRGLKLEELKKVSNIEDIVFVHSNGFIGGAKSLESALRMVDASLESR
jgi:uncharacterized UPF0160 family protein